MRALRDRWRRFDRGWLATLLERAAPAKGHGADERAQTLSPWAIAVAVLALLGFGVLVGSTVSPAQSNGPTQLLEASSGSHAVGASTSAPTTPPPSKAEATPSSAESESTTEEANKEEAKEEGNEESGKKAKKAAKSKSKGSKSPSGEGHETTAKEKSSGLSASGLPPIEHVFLIVLSEEGYEATFGGGPSVPYMSKTLPSEGELLESYYAVADGEPANGIALISGQGPTPQTLQGCQLYSDLTPAGAGPEEQTLGNGCVYPKTTPTISDQLESAGKTWRAYIEGVDTGTQGTPTSCRHPQLGASDSGEAASSADGYVTQRNPFVYFHSLIDGPSCAKNDVGIGQLASDLAGSSKVPSLAYIAPDACDDGSQKPCVPGAPAGLGPAEAFLRKVVGEIEKSTAYKESGLIAITFDQAPQSGPDADSTGCCVSAPYPNVPAGSTTGSTTVGSSPVPSSTGAQSATSAGGGKVGLLLISKYVKPGSLNVLGEYDHYSLLLTLEHLFGLKPLGYAGAKGLLAFDSSVFNAQH